MDQIKLRSDVIVKLIDHMGSDSSVVSAAKVSTTKLDTSIPEDQMFLIKFLMKNRHGTPFEHIVFKFYIEIPIAVARELHRHRIASYNEMSARYTEMLPHFWVPDENRKLKQIGKPGHYEYIAGTKEETDKLRGMMLAAYSITWIAYQDALRLGVAREVARYILPVGIYTRMIMTINARSLMNLLSLRINHMKNTYASFPMREIEQMAEQMDDIFRDIAPLVWMAFNDNGRVSP